MKEGEAVRPFIYETLGQHTTETRSAMPDDYTTFEYSFSLHDGDKIVAGMTAKEQLGEMFIELLAVAKEYRKSGLGKRLLDVIEQKARERKCNHLLVTTYSYQGENYYPKFGFKEMGRIPDYPMQGVAKIYFIRLLK